MFGQVTDLCQRGKGNESGGNELNVSLRQNVTSDIKKTETEAAQSTYNIINNNKNHFKTSNTPPSPPPSPFPFFCHAQLEHEPRRDLEPHLGRRVSGRGGVGGERGKERRQSLSRTHETTGERRKSFLGQFHGLGPRPSSHEERGGSKL